MSTNSIGGSSGGWDVTMVTPRTDVASGQPVKGHLVSFTTKNGNRSEVFIPDNITDIKQARQMIADKVAYVDALGASNG